MEEVPWFAMGSTPFQGGWHDLLSPLLDFPLFFSSDVRKMDSHMHVRFMLMDNDFAEAAHRSVCDPVTCFGAFDYINRGLVSTRLVLPDGHTFEKHQGHSSGGRCTCGRNSRYMYFLLIFGYKYSKLPYAFEDVFRIRVFGDDIIGSTCLTPAQLNLVYEGVRTMGHEVTLEMADTLEKLAFLSFGTRKIGPMLQPFVLDEGRLAAHVLYTNNPNNSEKRRQRLESIRTLCRFNPELFAELTQLLESLGEIPQHQSIIDDMYHFKEEGLVEQSFNYKCNARGDIYNGMSDSKAIVITRPVKKTTRQVRAPATGKPKPKSAKPRSSSTPSRPPPRSLMPNPPSGLVDPVSMSACAAMIDPQVNSGPPICRTAAYSSYPDCSVFQGQLSTNNDFFCALTPNFENNFHYTGGVVTNYTLDGSATKNVMTMTQYLNIGLGGGTYIPTKYFSCPGGLSTWYSTGGIGSGWKFAAGAPANVVKMKIAVVGSLAHSLTVGITGFTGVSTPFTIATVDLPPDGVTLNFPALAGETIFQIAIHSNQASAALVTCEIYASAITSCSLLNNATSCKVLSLDAIESQSYCLTYQKLWVECTSASLADGGNLWAGTFPPGFHTSYTDTLQNSIAALPFDKYIGAFKHGTVGFQKLPDLSSYAFKPFGEAQINHPTMVVYGSLQAGATFTYKIYRTVHHQSSTPSYGKMYPPFTANWVIALDALARLDAWSSNAEHTARIQRALKALSKFLTSPSTWKTGAQIATFAASLLV